MEKLTLKPEKEQRKLWFITWAIVFVIVTPFWIVAPFFEREVVVFFSVFLFIWLVIMKRCMGGVVWKKYVTVPYSKITNVDITRGPLQRLYNIGTIHVQTAGAAGKQGEKAELKLAGIRDLEKVREVIIENIKDLNYPGSGRMKKEIPSGGDIVVNDILNELRDIKGILREKE